VISRHGPCPGLKFSPRCVVTVLKFGGGAFFIRKIARSKNGSRDSLEELGRGARSFYVLATCDVACTNERKGFSVG
jgi:hypothetical protein